MKLKRILKFLQKEDEAAKSHIKNLITVAIADGKFKDEEFELIRLIAKKNNIAESQLQEILKDSQGVEFEIPKDKNKKFYQLYDLVHMMIVDQVIHDKEQKFCNLFAVKFGYSKEHAEELVESIVYNIINGQKPKEAMNRVARLLNH